MFGSCSGAAGLPAAPSPGTASSFSLGSRAPPLEPPRSAIPVGLEVAGCRTEARLGGALNAFKDLTVKGAGPLPGIEKAARRISDESLLLNRSASAGTTR